jgi:hypothetical protein
VRDDVVPSEVLGLFYKDPTKYKVNSYSQVIHRLWISYS